MTTQRIQRPQEPFKLVSAPMLKLCIDQAQVPGYQGLQQIWIDQHDQIQAIHPSNHHEAPAAQEYLAVDSDWISLGGLDLQINGALGLAFPDLTEANQQQLQAVGSLLWQQGVDGYLPTIVTTAVEKIHHALAARANNQCQGRGETCSVGHFLPFAQLFATMRPGRCTRPPLVGSAPAMLVQKPRNLVRAATGPFTAASARKASPLAFPTYFSGALANNSRGVLEIASGVAPDFALSEHGPCFVKGAVTLDDLSFTMKNAFICRATLDLERHWTPI